MLKESYCNKHGRPYYYQCPECASEASKIDINEIAEKAKEKKEQKQKDGESTQKRIDEAVGIKYKGAFEVCPDCGLRTLLYNKARDKKQCNNPNCRTNFKKLSERLNDDWAF